MNHSMTMTNNRMTEYFILLDNVDDMIEDLEDSISENLMDLISCDVTLFRNKVRSIIHNIRSDPDFSIHGRWLIKDAIIDLYRHVSWIESDRNSEELNIVKNAIREYIMISVESQ